MQCIVSPSSLQIQNEECLRGKKKGFRHYGTPIIVNTFDLLLAESMVYFKQYTMISYYQFSKFPATSWRLRETANFVDESFQIR